MTEGLYGPELPGALLHASTPLVRMGEFVADDHSVLVVLVGCHDMQDPPIAKP
jgi:hypothetical protein